MANERLSKIADFVQQRLRDKHEGTTYNLDYRWNHTLRVTNYGKQLALAENANVELVVAACLLHDVAHFDEGDLKDHGRRGARVSRPFLQELGYAPEDVENICYSIAAHVDGKADFEHAETLESKIVSDADNIDRFGAFRILQRYAPHVNDFAALIGDVSKRIQTLEKYRQQRVMGTDTGHALFNQQLDFQIAFFNKLIDENELTRLPAIP